MKKGNYQLVLRTFLLFSVTMAITAPSYGAGVTKTDQVRENQSDKITSGSSQTPAATASAGSGTAVMDLNKQASERNRRACVEWCDANTECAMCRASGLCGSGYKVLRTWGGPGVKWDACRFVSRAPRVHPRPPEGRMQIPGEMKSPVPPIPQ